jgi:hypothetical protein
MRYLCFIIIGFLWTESPVVSAQEESPGEDDVTESAGDERSVSIGGIVDIVHTEGDNARLNQNTLGDNNFNKIRSLLNFRFEQRDRLSADVEILFDDASRDRIRLQGAFVTLFNLPDERLNIMVGKIPNLFGNYARREFSDVNPLIGQPLSR